MATIESQQQEQHQFMDPAVEFSSSSSPFHLSDYFGMMASSAHVESVKTNHHSLVSEEAREEQQMPSENFSSSSLPPQEEEEKLDTSTTRTTSEKNTPPMLINSEFHYRVDGFNNCSESCRNFLKHFQAYLSFHGVTEEPNHGHHLSANRVDLDLKDHMEISSLIEQFIVTIELSSSCREDEASSNNNNIGNSPNASLESSSSSSFSETIGSDVKTIELATMDIKGKLTISKTNSSSIQAASFNSDSTKSIDSNKLWLQLDSLSGISFHKWIEKIIFPYLRLSNIPPKIYNHLNVWHDDLVRINPDLTQEMTEVFFACYPSLFKQLSEHYPYSNDQKNCHLLLAEHLIGILWMNYLNIHEKRELHIFNEMIMERILYCLKYWIQYYSDRLDFLTNQFVSNALQQVIDLLQNLQLLSEESQDKLTPFKDCISSIREMLKHSQKEFPFSMSGWSEYVEMKKEELGLNDNIEENEEEKSPNEQQDADLIPVEEIVEEEEDGEEEEDVDLSEMFHNLSCSIMSQFDLSQIQIPELFKDKLDETMLNTLLETTFDNIDSDSSQRIQQFVLSFLKIIYPERSELDSMPSADLYFEFISLWPPLEIAKQLTNYEFVYCFEACNTHDFFATISKISSTSNTNSPQNPYNLNHMIERFNWLSFWICYMILKQRDMQSRVKTMAFFVQVMLFVMCLQNYQSSMSILSAFHSTSIVKLSKAWDQLSTFENDQQDVMTFNLPSFPYYQFLKGANELFSFDKKFFNLKCHIISEIEKKLQSSESAISCIPYIGTFLGEISAIETYFNDFFSFNDSNIPQHGHNKPQHHHHHQNSLIKTNSNTTIHTHQIPHHYMFNYEKKKKITKPIKEIQTFQKLSRTTASTIDVTSNRIPHALFKPVPILHVLLSTSELIKSLPKDPKISEPVGNVNVNPLIRSDSLSSIGLDSPTLSTVSNSSNNGSGFFQSQSVMMLMALKSNAHSDYIKKIFREMAKEIVKNE
nr:unnamed protein product [Naegleria fowleri]